MPEFVIRLGAAEARDPASTGNKGANLARLLHRGAPVPEGFCVSTAAYRRFVAANALEPRLALAGFRGAGEPERTALCAGIQRAFAAAVMPDEIAAEVMRACAELAPAGGAAGLRVAVRSSSTVEDSGRGSFAGVFGTSLNVATAADVIEAIRRTWATLWTPAAVAWLARDAFAVADYAMAVVVQRMLEPEAAGVMFTVNPVTGHPAEIVINAALGLGEGVVSGAVESDTIVVDAIALQVKSTVVARKTVRLVAAGGSGITEESVGGDAAGQPALAAARALELARLGLALQERFGAPQDIEWAMAEGRLWILQSRNVVAQPPWFPVPARIEAAPAVEAWMLEFPELFSPFGRSLEALKNPVYRGAVARMLGVPVANTQVAINGFIYQHEVVGRPRLLPRAAFRVLQLVRWLGRARREDRVFHEQAIPRLTARLAGIRATLRAPAALSGRIDSLRTAVAAYLEFEAAAVPVGVLANAFSTAVLRLCARWVRDPALDPAALLLGVPNATLVRDAELARLGERLRAAGLRAWPDEPGATTAELVLECRQFQETYGYVWADRNPKDPAWATNEDFRSAFFSQAARREKPEPEETARRVYGEMSRALTRGVRRRVLPLERLTLDYFLALARRYYPCREDYNHHLSTAVMVIGETLRAIGGELVARSALEHVEHIFTLTFEEITALPDEPSARQSPALADAGRRFREAQGQRHLRPPAVVTPGKSVPPPERPAAGGRRLTGVPGSAGVAVGRARVVRRSELGNVRAGEILVCDTVRPEWSPILMLIAGLVTDRGYALSHGANLARESGVPAVLGTGRATELIQDGEVVRVDGTAGIVSIEPEPHAD